MEWIENDNKLLKKFAFRDFAQAMAFMQSVALVCEEMDHHPWWSNSYNVVEIQLQTHSKGDIVTSKDRQLAKEIDKIYAP
ncbi:MAG: 4a-hydroxytetrahydrobiopterin dehydratase [Bacteroidota bacterium]|nr:4a-hydroxytetrahydrobiopterin dehydratase [Bacteroidota bacterium]